VITQRNVELLLLRRIEPGIWHAIGKPGKYLKAGSRFNVKGSDVIIEVIDWHEGGIRVLKLSTEKDMESWGHTPLPPYIRQPLEDPERYQTIYSQTLGSVAAPTAGLHFTKKVLDDLKRKGVYQTSITLHIGIDTFRPVDVEDPMNHHIHREYIFCDSDTAKKIKSAKQNGGRVIAVGTTVVRTLEQLALWYDLGAEDIPSSMEGWADILILPGHKFRVVDSMITNFHLPKSTVLMMTSAFAGWDRIEHAYMEAMKMNYRFYSFGDSMLIL
jgi:S-adenosylmethionine:tRNA ribosyltransferase-isomerase